MPSGGAPPVTGILSASFTVNAGPFDVTAQAGQNWTQYETGDGVPANSKLGGVGAIGNVIGVGGTLNGTTDFGHHLVWSDGTPNASGDTLNAVFVNTTSRTVGPGKSLPAGNTTRNYRIFCGGYNGTVFLQATLSDGSAAAIVDQNLMSAGAGAVVAGWLDLEVRTTDPSGTVDIVLGMDSAGAFTNSGIQAIVLL